MLTRMFIHRNHQTGGHYTCYARHRTNQWLHFNDDRVSKVDKGDVVTPAAYLLIYVRTDAMPIPHDALFPVREGGEAVDVEEIRRARYTNTPQTGDAARRGVAGASRHGAGPCVVM